VTFPRGAAQDFRGHSIAFRGVYFSGMGPHTILYVEDDDGAFFLARLTLKELIPEPQLLRACDGEQALAILQRVAPYQDAPRPDLILLDVNLPKKNGFEVLSDLKRSESLRTIPVVVFSTSRRQSDISASLALGARDYITKPSSFDLFVEALKSACATAEKPPPSELTEE
jgi:CheY-like chemotaxis protein